MNETFQDVQFPVLGVDISDAYSDQRPGTTPVGVNVRAFEPSTQRARGGARPGLTKWMPAAMANAEVQNLDIIVTTTLLADAVQVPAPSATVAGTVGTILDQSLPQAQTNNDEGSFPDPSDGGRNLLADGSVRRVRPGGSGNYTHGSVRPVFVSNGTTGANAGLVQFFVAQLLRVNPGNNVGLKINLNVVAGNVLVIAYGTSQSSSGPNVIVSDSQGNFYSQGGGDVRGQVDSGDSSTKVSVGIFTATINASGLNEITIASDTATTVTVSEFLPGMGTPVALQGSGTFSGALSVNTTDQISLTTTKSYLLISAYLTATASVSSVTSNMNLLVNQPDTSSLGVGLIVTTGILDSTVATGPNITISAPGATHFELGKTVAIGDGGS